MPFRFVFIDLLEGKDYGTTFVVHEGTDLKLLLELLADEEGIVPASGQDVLILRPVKDLKDGDYVLFTGLSQNVPIPLGLNRHRDNVRGRTPTE